jgi:SAM-dependent methyltransferase
VDLLEAAIARWHGGSAKSVLDIGCGTGGHALVLAERGHEVVGVDLSPAMLERAREKASAAGQAIEFVEGDARSFDLGRTFDVATFFFAVLGYQQTTDDVRAALASARRHLEPGGLLFLDIWNGPGVVADPPGTRERVFDTPDGPVTRIASSDLDVRRQIATVHYRLECEGREPEEETHVMRFFFPAELELLMDLEGFELLALSPAASLDGDAGRDDWTALVVARAVRRS